MPSRTERKKITHASVIVPAYNAEGHIRACLDALRAQSVAPAEIIVVDDGSTDATAKLVRENYPQVKLVTQPNQGPARARNHGARIAKSEIIVFIDSDCVAEKDWLQEMMSPFSDEQVVGVQGAYKTRQKSLVAQFDQMDIEYRYARMYESQAAKKLDWIATYSAAYRKKLFLACNGFDETFPRASGEDAELSYRLSARGHVLRFNPRAVVYHTHPATLGKYLHVKFFRAYWRMRMYRKYPEKMVQDSYTPQSLKVGIVIGSISGLFVLALVYFFAMTLTAKTPLAIGIDFLLLISGVMVGLFLGGMSTIVVSQGLLQRIARAGIGMKLFSPYIVCLRAIAFGLGMLFGILDSRVRA